CPNGLVGSSPILGTNIPEERRRKTSFFLGPYFVCFPAIEGRLCAGRVTKKKITIPTTINNLNNRCSP
ncbi:hypothetical protein, partial [Enterobacter hormaechei]